MTEQEAKKSKVIMLSARFYNVKSSSDSQERNILEICMDYGYVVCIFKQYPYEIEHIRWPYICQLCFNGSLQTCIEDKTTPTIKSVQTQSTFIWRVVKAVAYKWNKRLSTEK